MKTTKQKSKSVGVAAEQQKKLQNGSTHPKNANVKLQKSHVNVLKNVRPQGRGR